MEPTEKHDGIDKVTTSTENDTQIQTAPEKPRAERTFTQADVDRIVADRLARERRAVAEARAKQEATQKSAEQEAQPQAGQEAPAEAEQEAEPVDLAQRLRELEERNREYQDQVMRAQSREILAARGLPVSLEKLIDYSSAEACHASIDSIDEVFRKAVQEGVDARIRVPSPRMPAPQRGPDYEHMSDEAYYTARYGQKWNGRR